MVLSLRPQMCVSSPMFNPSLCRTLLEGIISMSLVQSLTHEVPSALQVLRYFMAPDDMKWQSPLLPPFFPTCLPSLSYFHEEPTC